MSNHGKNDQMSAAFGIQLKESHFRSRISIDAYGDGGFRIADQKHLGSLLCLPSGIYGWNVASPDDFTVENFRSIMGEAENIEILLIGCGQNLSPIGANLRIALRRLSISADPMSTGAAVRTFNVLLSEGRAVAAALLAVE